MYSVLNHQQKKKKKKNEDNIITSKYRKPIAELIS